MADLERSDTVAREPSMRAKTIIIPTLTLTCKPDILSDVRVHHFDGKHSKYPYKERISSVIEGTIII